jgi:hypothetical protein
MSDELKHTAEPPRQFETGALRDSAGHKGRFDLLAIHGVVASALQMQRGANRYGARNWEKGMPLSVYADSALRHLLKAIAGYDDEPHLDAAIWNLLCWAEGQERIRQGIWPPELDDLPHTYAGKEPPF